MIGVMVTEERVEPGGALAELLAVLALPGGSMFNLEPHDDRIVVRPDEPIGKTPGGILLPDQAKEKAARGTVLAVGPGLWVNGHMSPMVCKVGMRIAYNKYSGTEVEDPATRENVLVLREAEVIGHINEPQQSQR